MTPVASARQAARSSDTSAPARRSCQSSSSENTSWPATKARKLDFAGTDTRIGPCGAIRKRLLSKKLSWRLTRTPRTAPSGSRKTLALTLTSSGPPRNISSAASSQTVLARARVRTGSPTPSWSQAPIAPDDQRVVVEPNPALLALRQKTTSTKLAAATSTAQFSILAAVRQLTRQRRYSGRNGMLPWNTQLRPRR